MVGWREMEVFCESVKCRKQVQYRYDFCNLFTTQLATATCTCSKNLHKRQDECVRGVDGVDGIDGMRAGELACFCCLREKDGAPSCHGNVKICHHHIA